MPSQLIPRVLVGQRHEDHRWLNELMQYCDDSLKLVMIDCYGTLVAEPDLEQAASEALNKYAKLTPPQAIERFKGLRLALTSTLKSEFHTHRDRFGIIAYRFAKEMGLGERCGQLIQDSIMCAFADAPVYPETVTLLRELAERGREILLLTNGDNDSIRSVTSRLPRLFNHIVTSEDAGFYKPDPRMFEHALAITTFSSNAAIMIGDSMRRDCQPARKLGIRAVLLTRTRNPTKHPVANNE